MTRLENLLANLLFGLNLLLLFLLAFETQMDLPKPFEVIGRMHPLFLHLPIGILLFLALLPLLRKEVNRQALIQVQSFTLHIAALLAALTALMGLFLAQEDGYLAEQVAWHKWTGAGVSFGSYLLLLIFRNAPERTGLYHVLLYSNTALLLIAGHLGGSITHGENFLLAPFASATQVITPQTPVFQAMVEPLLKSKCYSCHNDRKAKGDLIMTSREALEKGGKNGKIWEVGKPADSEIIRRAHLPLEEKEHMPPEGKPQLTDKEIDLLETWIHTGASFKTPVIEWLQVDSLRPWVMPVLQAGHDEEGAKYVFDPASDNIVVSLNTPFRTVRPVALNSPGLQVEIFVRGAYEDKFLTDLQKIKTQLVSLDLTNLPIKDDALTHISGFPNLEKLILNGTDITGSTLEQLKACENLKSLALANTAIDREAVSKLGGFPSLRSAYVWNTSLDSADVAGLREELDGIALYDGYRPDKEEMLELPPPQMPEKENVFVDGHEIVLENKFPGAIIRYTTDGTEPDSSESKAFEQHIKVQGLVQLRAKAVKAGWLSSKSVEWMFFTRGIRPDTAEFLNMPKPEYSAEGVMSLFDSKKGDADNFKRGNWLGYIREDFDVLADYGQTPPVLDQLVVSYLQNMGAFIFPPTKVSLWGGNDKNSLGLLKEVDAGVPDEYDRNRNGVIVLDFPPSQYRYYRVVAEPVKKLPSWHQGAGSDAWVFVDELFLYANTGKQQ